MTPGVPLLHLSRGHCRQSKKAVSSFHRDQNFVLPSVSFGSSRLGPHLHFGLDVLPMKPALGTGGEMKTYWCRLDLYLGLQRY